MTKDGLKILVFGQTGQVATELQAQAPVLALGRDAADLSAPGSCAAAIQTHRPDLVINAAAYTAVDDAEENEALATVINGKTPGDMARACATLDIPFCHVSTDYVFDGTGSAPRAPSAPVAPINAYGRSKLAGEAAVREAGGRSVILRTSWVFSAHGANFVKTMLRLSQTRDTLSIVADQVGGPTPAADIAAALLRIGHMLIDGSPGGTYHFSGQPDVSWAGFATEIFAQAGRSVQVTPVSSAEYPTRAARPLNSRLDCGATETDFGIARPDWRRSLEHILKDLETT